jgi:hypothetical protein
VTTAAWETYSAREPGDETIVFGVVLLVVKEFDRTKTSGRDSEYPDGQPDSESGIVTD